MTGELPEDSPADLVEHFFRHESGKLIASLVRFFGLRHFDLVEDTVQAALVEALRTWRHQGIPNKPSAWIHRVAKNRVLDRLRRDKKFAELATSIGTSEASLESLDSCLSDDQLQDNLLRMLFTCCHPDLPADAAIPLTLKTVCGFGEREIAQCLLIQGATVRKRIYRAKRSLIQRRVSYELPGLEQLSARLQTVHNVLYLMFNEGYASSVSDAAIRMDVCEEAARLCHLLTLEPKCSNHTTHALLALMLFHACRFGARIDQEGALVLLEDQDRELWDRRLMNRAMEYLHYASTPDEWTSYHLEAAIAMHHCRADSFANTNWPAIIALYDKLLASRPSPVYELNRAIAVGQRDGPQTALALLHDLRSDSRLADYHLLDATFGELYRRSGELDTARQYYTSAMSKTQSASDRELLRRRLSQLGS